MTENSDNYIRTYRKTETTNTLAAGKTITLAAGENLSARNTTVLSENGQITVAAKGDVNLENGYNESRDDYGLKYKERGLLSHKTTTIKSHNESKTATGSLLSGDTVQLEAGANITIKGSTIVGAHDVTMTSGKDTTIESAEEKEQHTYDKQVKKSGLMGSGLGFTIGKEKRNNQYQEADALQKASTVGSLQGNVSISSHHDTHVIASDIMAGKDISMTGENITITSKDNVYHSDEKHEYEKSGLTVSASGGTADILTNTIDDAKKASNARDKQLKALYSAEVYETMAKGKDSLNHISEKGMPGIKAGIGSSAFKATSHTETTEAVGSNLVAKGDMQITAKKDMGMKGSTRQKHLPMSDSQGGVFYFSAFFRSSSGSVWFTTLSSVMVHFTTSFMPGISYMTFCMIFSMIARRPRAPVLRSIAWRAIAWMAASSMTSSTPSMASSFLYCLTRAFFGSVRILTRASSFSG